MAKKSMTLRDAAKQSKGAVKVALTSVTPSIQDVELQLIHSSKTNPRKTFDEAKIKELAESITKHGVLQAILLRPHPTKKGSYELVAGERRYRAAKVAGLETIPSNIRELNDQETLEIQVIENLQREDISPIEEADGYVALVKKHGYTPETLAAKIGKSQSYVRKRMQLATLVPKAKEAFERGEIALGLALYMCRFDERAQIEITKVLTSNQYQRINSVKELERWVEENILQKMSNALFPLADAKLDPKAGPCTTCPYRSGNDDLLFDDMPKKDVCTKPSCFKEKTKTWWHQQSKKPAGDGQEYLPEAQCMKLFKYEHSDQVDSDQFVSAEACCYDHPGYKKYSELVGKQLKPVLAITRRGHLVKLFRRNEAMKIIRDLPSMKNRPVDDWKERQKRESKKRKFENQVRNQLFERIAATVHTNDMPPVGVLKLATKSVALTQNWGLDPVLRRHGVQKIDHGSRDRQWVKLIDGFTDDQCLELLLEITIERFGTGPSGKEEKALVGELLSLYGIDAKTVEQELRDALKAKEKEKQAKAKKKLKPAAAKKSVESTPKKSSKGAAGESRPKSESRQDPSGYPLATAKTCEASYSADLIAIGKSTPVLRGVVRHDNKLYVCTGITHSAEGQEFALNELLPESEAKANVDTETRGYYDGRIVSFKGVRFAMGSRLDITFDEGPSTQRKCRKCGCTEDNACQGGCSWVEQDLCSACSPAAIDEDLADAYDELEGEDEMEYEDEAVYDE